MPARRDNWPNLLAQFIEQRREQPFAWGSNDCCLFGADWIQLCTGLDPAAVLRGTYDSALSGMRVLKNHGGLIGTIQTHMEPLGFKPIAQGLAARGDIAVRDCGNGNTMSIVIGSKIAYVGQDGLLFADLNDGVETRFWKI